LADAGHGGSQSTDVIVVALPWLKANGVGGSGSLFEIAEYYADLGEKDHAFEWFYVTYQEHGHLL
jgi:hypothetical protein